MTGARSGLSLLEALVALAILMIALVPLIETFRGGFRATQMGREHTQALYIADSILEEVRARVATKLGRFYTISDDAKTIESRVSAGAWKGVFQSLAEPRKKLVGTDRSQVSTYFATMVDMKGGSPGPIGADSDPVAQVQLAAFTTEVAVNFDVAGAPIDSNGDKTTETDMCEVVVTVRWSDRATEGPGEPRQLTISSLFSLEDFNRSLGGL